MAPTKFAHLAEANPSKVTIEEHNANAQALREMSDLLATCVNPEACWPKVAPRVAALFSAEQCAITTPDASAETGVGPVQQATGSTFVQTSQGALLSLPAAPDDATGAALCVPILLDAKVVAMIRISGPQRRPHFSKMDRERLSLVALVIEKSLHVIRLKQVLNSRFAQIALAQNTDKAVGDVVLNAAQCPAEMVKIIAKSFYREMTKAGFGSKEIINTASEIIAQLTKSLQKHSRRVNSGRTPATPGDAA